LRAYPSLPPPTTHHLLDHHHRLPSIASSALPSLPLCRFVFFFVSSALVVSCALIFPQLYTPPKIALMTLRKYVVTS
jgi:hypothetical protein